MTRLLLWCGVLAGLVLFAGDLAFLAVPAAGRSFNSDRVLNVLARVPIWRLYAGAAAAPVGTWLELLGMLGLWRCARSAAPRAAAVMLVSLATFDIFGLPVRGQFAPVAFAVRFCGSDGDAVRHLTQLAAMLTGVAAISLGIGMAVWIGLTIRRQTGVAAWTVLATPIATLFLWPVLALVPAPLGFSLVAGWNNLAFALFFAVVALTWRGAPQETVR